MVHIGYMIVVFYDTHTIIGGQIMKDESDIRSIMIKNTLEELDELEKGIVLATIEIEKMQSNVGVDLYTSSQIRLRREQLESEWEKAKKRLSELKSGNLPNASKADEKIRKAKYNLKKVKELAEAKESKQKSVQDDLYEGDTNG
jgi:hypothetical protein